jgi:hypothetical protein
MQTRPVMSAAAILMAGAGLALQFAPHEVLAATGAAATPATAAATQVGGALYLGFAMLDWMSRGVRMGGIYARPLVMANLVHFVAGGLALLKFAATGATAGVWAIAVVYAALAVAFTSIAFTHPSDV